MKLAVIDANIFIDLIKLQMLTWLFQIGFEVYTTQEIIDQLNENQSELLKEFIKSRQLIIYLLTSQEFEEVVNLTTTRSLELADKSVAWLSLHLKAIVISGDGPLRRFCESQQLEVRGMLWFFDLLVKDQLIVRSFAAQKMEQLLQINSRLPRDKCERRIQEWKGQ